MDARVARRRCPNKLVNLNSVSLGQRQKQLRVGRRCPDSRRDSVLTEMPGGRGKIRECGLALST